MKKYHSSEKFQSSAVRGGGCALRLKSAGMLLLAILFLAVPGFARQPAADPQGLTASVSGVVTVTNGAGSTDNLAGITVKLTGPAPEPTSRSAVTDADGRYEFSRLASGKYAAEANLEGFKPWTSMVTLTPGQAATLNASLQINTISEQVEVKGEATDVATESVSASATVSEKQLEALPLRTEELAEALAFSPSVIRTQEGKLNFNGQTESQGMLLVDSTENVDPVAGSFAIPVPSGVIQSLRVYSSPDSSEFGGFSGGLTKIDLKSPPPAWSFKVSDFFPAFRAKNGDLVGLANMIPRFEFGGPLIKDKLSFFEDMTYEYRRDPTRGLSWPYNEKYRRSFNSFTQLQATLSPRQVLNFNINFFPQNLQFINITSLIPQAASVDYRRRGVSAGVSDSYQMESGVILNAVARYTRFDSSTLSQGKQEMEITPEGWGQNFFNDWARKTNQVEILPTAELPTKSWLGHHDLKFGTDLLYRTYGGQSVLRPIQVRAESPTLTGAQDGSLKEQIDFQGTSLLRATSKEIAEFAEDRWTITSSFSINFGGRLSSQSIGRSVAFAPRGGLAYSPGKGKTVFRAGAGVLYGHVPLLAADFSDNQARTISMYNSSGALIGSPTTLQYLYLAPGTTPSSPGSQHPDTTSRTLTWNAEVESAVMKSLSVRIGYLDSRSRELFIVDPILPVSGTNGVLALTNNGASQYRQVEVTAHYRPTERTDLNFTYVWSRARGDLNSLSDIFVPIQAPVIRPNVYGISSSDVPQRFITGGLVHLPWWQLMLSPVLDVHSGFPYSNLDVLQNYVGTPNSLRFPVFFSLDGKIYRDIPLHLPFFDNSKTHKFRVGVFALNLTNHQNPHDVFSNNASPPPLFGQFAGFQRRFVGISIGLGE